jgi:hypothetical protein
MYQPKPNKFRTRDETLLQIGQEWSECSEEEWIAGAEVSFSPLSKHYFS